MTAGARSQSAYSSQSPAAPWSSTHVITAPTPCQVPSPGHHRWSQTLTVGERPRMGLGPPVVVSQVGVGIAAVAGAGIDVDSDTGELRDGVEHRVAGALGNPVGFF